MHDVHGGVEDDALPAQRLQLRDRPVARARLAEDVPPAHGELVGADDETVGMPAGDDFGLAASQPADQVDGRFARERGFVDVRGGDRERHAQPLQQLLAIDGGRSQHQPQLAGRFPGAHRGAFPGVVPVQTSPTKTTIYALIVFDTGGVAASIRAPCRDPRPSPAT